MHVVPFGSTCTLQNGRAFKPSEWSEIGTPIVRIQNLNDESKSFNYCNFEVEERFHIKTGDLLFSWSGTPGTSFGAFFWNRGKGFLNQHIFRVDMDESKVDKNYLRYAINSKLKFIIDQAHGGVGLKHITKGKLEAIKIPLPPLAEQKRIADILDKADGIRRKRQQAIDLADEFLRATFLDMFGDPVTNSKQLKTVTLGNLVSDKTDIVDGPFGSSINTKTDYIADGEIPVIRTKNVSTNGDFLSKDLKFISNAKYETLKRSQVIPGDIVLTKVGTIGNVCIFPKAFPKAILSTTGSCRIRINETMVNKLYFYYYLRFYKPKMIQAASAGAVQPFLNMKQIKDFYVPMPDREQQQLFASYASKIASLRSKFLLSDMAPLTNALSQKAFAGQLTV